MNAPRYVPTWMKSFLAWKAQGHSDQKCCNAIGLSMNDLQAKLDKDADFRSDYDRVQGSPSRAPYSY